MKIKDPFDLLRLFAYVLIICAAGLLASLLYLLIQLF